MSCFSEIQFSWCEQAGARRNAFVLTLCFGRVAIDLGLSCVTSEPLISCQVQPDGPQRSAELS